MGALTSSLENPERRSCCAFFISVFCECACSSRALSGVRGPAFLDLRVVLQMAYSFNITSSTVPWLPLHSRKFHFFRLPFLLFNISFPINSYSQEILYRFYQISLLHSLFLYAHWLQPLFVRRWHPEVHPELEYCIYTCPSSPLAGSLRNTPKWYL